MGKRQAPIVYNGSMKKYFWGYINKYHLYINAKDHYAYNYCRGFVTEIHKDKQKFPGNTGIDIRVFPLIGKDNHSHVIVGWVSKMEKKFYIHHSHLAIEELYSKIKYYNDLCEDMRNLEGHDDEPEDEISFLT